MSEDLLEYLPDAKFKLDDVKKFVGGSWLPGDVKGDFQRIQLRAINGFGGHKSPVFLEGEKYCGH